jgi:hypothetical protein
VTNPFSQLTEYELRHLPQHLVSIGSSRDLHRVLTWPTAADGNAWYEAKDSTVGTAAYVSDVRLAWASIGDSPKGVAARGQYAVLISSINSIAGNLPPPLVTALAERRVWTVDRAIAYARQTPDPIQRCNTMVQLKRLMERHEAANWCTEAVASARAIGSADDRADCLSSILSEWCDDPPTSLFQAILENARSARTGYERNHARRPLMRAVEARPAFLGQVIEIFRGWGETIPLPLVLLATRSRAAAFEDDIAASMEKWLARLGPAGLALKVKVLEGSIPPAVHRKLVVQAFQAAIESTTDVFRQRAFVSLLPYLPAWRRRQAVREVLAYVRDHSDDLNFASGLLVDLASNAGPEFQERIVATARSLSNEPGRKKALTAIAASLEPIHRTSVLDEMLQLAAQNEGEAAAEDIERLAPLLSPEQRSRALSIASVWTGTPRIRALVGLLPVMQATERDALLRETLERVLDLPKHEFLRTRALPALAPLLPATDLVNLVSRIRIIDDATSWVPALPILARHCVEGTRVRIWRLIVKVTPGIQNEWRRVEALPAIVQHLPSTMHDELLGLAKSFEQPLARVETLATLAPYIEPSQRDGLVNDAVQEAGSLDSGPVRCRCLARLVAVAGQDLRQILVEQIRTELNRVEWNEKTARILADVSYHLPLAEFEQWIIRALRKAPGRDHHSIVEALAPHLTEMTVRRLLFHSAALSVDRMAELADSVPRDGPTLTIDNTSGGFQALLVRLAQLGHAREAVSIAREQHSKGTQAALVSALAESLDTWMILDVYDEVVGLPASAFDRIQISRDRRPDDTTTTSMSGNSAREYVLAGLAPWVARSGQWQLARRAAIGFEDERWSAEALTEILPHVPITERAAVLREALTAIRRYPRERSRWLPRWALAASTLESADVVQLINEALEMESQAPRAATIQSLSYLAPALAGAERSLPDDIFAAVENAARWWP